MNARARAGVLEFYFEGRRWRWSVPSDALADLSAIAPWFERNTGIEEAGLRALVGKPGEPLQFAIEPGRSRKAMPCSRGKSRPGRLQEVKNDRC